MRAGGRMGGERREVKNKLVAVAIDKDKGSQSALKWATDHLLNRGQTVILLHVKNKNHSSIPPLSPSLSGSGFSVMSDLTDENVSIGDVSPYTRELFLPFRCFCTRKDIQCQDVVLEDTDVVKALIEYVTERAIEVLVLGAPSKNSFLRRFKAVDIPSSILKGVPDFCTVYVISKGKISATRAAARAAPSVSPFRNQTQLHSSLITPEQLPQPTRAPKLPSRPIHHMHHNSDSITSGGQRNGKLPFVEISIPERDMSFGSSSGRASVERSPGGWSSAGSDFDSQSCYDLMQLGPTPPRFSAASLETDNLSPSETTDDVEFEMRRLKMELKQTMDMYSTACKEALTAKEMAKELQRWKIEEEQRLEEARLAEEAALEIIEKEKEKSKAAIEEAEAAQRIAQLEEQKRIKAEMKALKEAEEKDMAINRFSQSDTRCRKYTIEEIDDATNFFSSSNKIGEGAYGPVYKCHLDHTPVAVKVLRPDAAHGRSQFQQEVDVLSCIRHPNMVLLVGACPEYGCLVYEFMSNGSLEDCLFNHNHHQQGKKVMPPLTWQQRFRIAAEITRGLLFLHQTKPEPLVHRDLKPANILLDRNYVAKISDVGLSRLVPPSVADTVTQFRMTSTAGTFCYIDPEYQKTGMLVVKSDVYALGIMFLQMITAKPPMGLTHHISQAIRDGTLSEMLDPSVPDWPLHETIMFANMALKCSEMTRKDRPDLGKVVLPQLEKLTALADQTNDIMFHGNHGQVSFSQDDMSYSMQSESVSSKSRSSISGWHV